VKNGVFSQPDVSGVVAVANGGTGAATATAARNNLGLYTGVFTLSVTNAASTTVPFGVILPAGVIPSVNSMVIFFSNTSGVFIKDAFITDTNFDGTDDQFRLNFNNAYTGDLKISYYITI
jgi:hypothetical protein